MSTAIDFSLHRASRLTRLRLDLADFEEKFTRSSGPGGQHVNKVSTAVSLCHRPTGIMVTAQDTRSQSANRQLAWDRVLDAIEQARREILAAERAERFVVNVFMAVCFLKALFIRIDPRPDRRPQVLPSQSRQ